MISMKDAEKFWNKMALYSDAETDNTTTSEDLLERTKKYLVSEAVILDFACGTGFYTNDLAFGVKHVEAIDTSEKMIELAQKRSVEHGIKNIKYVQANIFDQRYQKESFDVVLAFNILHLLGDAQAVLQRINELLKADGLFISSTACMGEKKSLPSLFLLFLSKTGLIPTLKYFSTSDLESLISGARFNIIEAEVLNKKLTEYFVVCRRL